MKSKKEERCCTALDMFKASFRKDKRVLYVALLELALIIVLVLGFYVLSIPLNRLAPQLESVTASLSLIQSSSLADMMGAKTDLTSLYTKILGYTIVYALFAIAVFFLVKSFIYCIVSKKRLSLALYWRFIVIGLVWGVVLAALLYLVQLLLYRIFIDSIATSKASQMVVVAVTAFAMLLLFYLTIALFTPLTSTTRIKDSLKSFYRIGLKRFARSLGPALLQFVVFVVLNLVMFIFSKVSQILFMLGGAVLLLAYVAWLRFYNTDVWHAAAGVADAQHKARKG